MLKVTVQKQDEPILRKKLLKDAIECAQKSVELDNDFSHGWYIYGLAFFQYGDFEKGFLLLDKAAQLGLLEAKLLYQVLKKQVSQ